MSDNRTKALMIAGQCWCDPETSGIEVDARLANSFADRVTPLLDKITSMLAAGDLLESQLCEAARERDRRRLTDEEREFLQNLHGAYEELANQTGYVNAAAQKEAREHAVLLKGLLEKHKEAQ